jgi:hypothetical protein
MKNFFCSRLRYPLTSSGDSYYDLAWLKGKGVLKMLIGMVFTMSFAQLIPPPRPPIDYEPGKKYRLEVTITQAGQGVEGIKVFLVKLGPGGRILPYGVLPMPMAMQPGMI